MACFLGNSTYLLVICQSYPGYLYRLGATGKVSFGFGFGFGCATFESEKDAGLALEFERFSRIFLSGFCISCG